MKNKICVIGMWHLGCVIAGCLSKMGNDVTCFDFNEKVIEDLKNNKMPIYEKGLKELFKDDESKGLMHFSTDLESIIPSVDFVYIAFDTPTNSDNEIDLTVIHKTVDSIKPLLKSNTIVLISSQLPVGTSEQISKKLGCEVCYSPENLRLGKAIECFMQPDRIIFGLSSLKIKNSVDNLFKPIQSIKVFMGLKEAEMIKHTLNTYLANIISFSGEISDICEKVGANAVDVMSALKLDKRVSRFAPVMPGLGFSGSTLARDVQTLRALGEGKKMETYLLDAILQVNIHRSYYVVEKLKTLNCMDKRITFLGLTYKAGTDTLRDSPALELFSKLKGVKLKAYDPKIKRLQGYDVEVCKNITAALDTDVVVIMTNYDEFRHIDYGDKIVIDTKNMLNPKKVNRYYGVGING